MSGGLRAAFGRFLYPRYLGSVIIVAAVVLLIIAEDVGHFLHLVYIPAIVVTKSNDRGIFVGHAVKGSAVAMPPAIVVDQFFAIVQQVHAPAEPIIMGAGFFKTITGISL